ncbi:MAG: 4-hydroxythreonine-4-phosphate dehydrogenase PdxA [Planctomycetota bacterium]
MRGALAVTLGDPAGIGPEIVARYLAEFRTVPARLVVVGSRDVFDAAWRAVGAPFEVPDLGPADAALALQDPGVGPAGPVPVGRASAAAGAASHGWVLAAADLALAGRVAGVVTAPIHKGAWALAGVTSPGHTEALRDHAGVPHVVMMLVGERLRVALATIHVPLARVPSLLTEDGLLDDLRVLDAALRGPFRLARPRIAVCGLNPHAGEGGLLGHEDDAVIAPAVAAARRAGIDATGPWPADACVPQTAAGHYDAALCMFHDQGLPAVKTLAPRTAVNVTLGLPFVRTSVDHGTAFDIAGRGVATPTSLDAAMRLAAFLVDTPRDEDPHAAQGDVQ